VRTQLGLDAPAEVVVPDRREERAGSSETRELDRRDSASARRFPPRFERMDDLSLGRNPLDAHELDPLDVAYNRNLHRAAVSHLGAGAR
jgi:hypothetical protein